MNMPLDKVFMAIIIMALITFGTRLFSFIVFRKHTPGPVFIKVQNVLPRIMLILLLVYSIKDTPWHELKQVVAVVVSLLFVVLMQLWRKNPLLSVFGGTILYMFFQSWYLAPP